MISLKNKKGVFLTTSKPTPDEIIDILKKGNHRFSNDESIHPNSDNKRLILAGSEDQGDHALATVITCSDSRVPVERIFDTGIMDIFVIRVAGNVAGTDEVGSIEFGLAHVNTPVLIFLGHTQCGAVTTVTHEVQGYSHKLERNIPPLVAPITLAVNKAITSNPNLHGDDIIPAATIENVWQGIEDLFFKSPAARRMVDEKIIKVVGAIYNVGTGVVEWLPEAKVSEILTDVEANPDKALNEFYIKPE